MLCVIKKKKKKKIPSLKKVVSTKNGNKRRAAFQHSRSAGNVDVAQKKKLYFFDVFGFGIYIFLVARRKSALQRNERATQQKHEKKEKMRQDKN